MPSTNQCVNAQNPKSNLYEKEKSLEHHSEKPANQACLPENLLLQQPLLLALQDQNHRLQHHHLHTRSNQKYDDRQEVSRNLLHLLLHPAHLLSLLLVMVETGRPTGIVVLHPHHPSTVMLRKRRNLHHRLHLNRVCRRNQSLWLQSTSLRGRVRVIWRLKPVIGSRLSRRRRARRIGGRGN